MREDESVWVRGLWLLFSSYIEEQKRCMTIHATSLRECS